MAIDNTSQYTIIEIKNYCLNATSKLVLKYFAKTNAQRRNVGSPTIFVVEILQHTETMINGWKYSLKIQRFWQQNGWIIMLCVVWISVICRTRFLNIEESLREKIIWRVTQQSHLRFDEIGYCNAELNWTLENKLRYIHVHLPIVVKQKFWMLTL